MVLRVMKAERTNELLGDPVWDESLMVQLPPAIFEMLMRFGMNAEVDTGVIISGVFQGGRSQ